MIDDWKWMRAAVDAGRKCPNGPKPRVGAVLVKDDRMLGEAHRGMSAPDDHAEYCLLEKLLSGANVAGSSLYTTLEPCTRPARDNPCSEIIIRRGITEVVIGVFDPNPKIHRTGWQLLRDAGIAVRDFHAALRAEIYFDNGEFLDKFRVSKRDSGFARFDYTLEAGMRVLKTPLGEIVTRWTPRSHDSIYALDYQNHVALARGARDFDEIDDPGAYDFQSYTVPVSTGEIAIFRNSHGEFAAVKVGSVLAGPERGDPRFELAFQYEIRSPRRS